MREYASCCVACRSRFSGVSSRSVYRFLCTNRSKSGRPQQSGPNVAWRHIWSTLWRVQYLVTVGSWMWCDDRDNFSVCHWLQESPLQHWPCDSIMKPYYLLTCDGNTVYETEFSRNIWHNYYYILIKKCVEHEPGIWRHDRKLQLWFACCTGHIHWALRTITSGAVLATTSTFSVIHNVTLTSCN